jgi:hypothetical protein
MYRQNLPVHRRAPGRIPDQRDVSRAPSFQERVLRMAKTPTLEASPKGRDVDRQNQADT